MPIYEYACAHCGHAFERLVPRADAPAPGCPVCGRKRVTKQFSLFAANVADLKGKACDDCAGSPACPSAGQGCAAGGCGW